MKFKKLLFAALALSPICAMAQAPRLVGLTNATYNHALSAFLNTDSTVYSYTGLNTYYDQALTSDYSYNLTGYYWASRTLQTYSGGHPTKINYQTCDTPTTWVDVSENDYTYDGSGNTIVAVRQSYNTGTSTWYVTSRNGYTYSGSDMLTDTSYYNAGKGYGPQSLSIYTYDGSHHVTSIYTMGYFGGSWYPAYREGYTLTSSGKDATDTVSRYNSKKSIWGFSSLDTYTYDGSDNMTSDTYQSWDTSGGGSWKNVMLQNWSFSGSDMITHDSASWNATAWNPIEHDSMSYDGSHNMIARLNSTWRFAVGKYIYTTEWLDTYNASNEILSSTTNSWSTSTSSWYLQPAIDTRALYYYEPLAVPEIANAGGSVKLYPVPARNFMNVNLNWNVNQNAVIAIYDLSGKLYRQWETGNSNNYSTSVSTNSLPAGNYIMKIQGANGMINEHFSVIH